MSENSFVDLDQARHDDQREVMRDIAERGICPFCPEHIETVGAEPEIHRFTYWHIRNNRWPYKGTSLHILIIHNEHVEDITELTDEAFAELKKIILWIKLRYSVSSYTVAIRSGEIGKNGSSVGHLHVHFAVADPEADEKPRFAMGSAKK